MCVHWFDVGLGLRGLSFVAVGVLGLTADGLRISFRATRNVAVSDTGGALMYVMGIWVAKRFI